MGSAYRKSSDTPAFNQEAGSFQLARILVVTLFYFGSAWGQIPEAALRLKIANVRYPPLAEAARVQGNAHVTSHAGEVTVLSGPPLLVKSALESAKALGSIQPEADLDLTYHFVIVDTARSVSTPVTVKRGDLFDRTLLRILGLKTEKVVVENRCEAGAAPLSEIRMNGNAIEVRIYGRTLCLQIQSSY